MAIYKLDDCKICKRLRAVKDGICAECQRMKNTNKVKLPEVFKDIFKNI